MNFENYSLSIKQLGRYLAEKQNLSKNFKGVNYSHAVSIVNNIVMFQDIESLFARMRTFSPSLINTLVKNKHLVHAPFKDGKLAYVGKDLLLYYLTILLKEQIEYKNVESKNVLEFIQNEGSSTRTKIMERFKLSKEEVMEILQELRSFLQIFMFYDGNRWTIYSSDMVIDAEKVSNPLATSEIIYSLIKSLGPITVPQIMKILNLPGGRVSTSIIDLFEKKRIIRGQFIENSSYESFLALNEYQYLVNFVNSDSDVELVEIDILPSSDILSDYWASADFMNLEEVQNMLVLNNGRPICSFDYKIIGDNLNIINIVKTSEYPNLEERIRSKIQEFAENKGKILVFPRLKSEVLASQSRDFAKIMIKRGYSARSSGLIFPLSKLSKKEASQNLVSISQLFPLLLDLQHLSKQKKLSSKSDILKGLSQLGIPTPLISLKLRIQTGLEKSVDEMMINKQLVNSKFAAFTRGTITSEDYLIYSKLSPIRHIGVLEEKTLNFINQKEKVDFNQLKSSLNLSDRVLLSTLNKLELSNVIIKSKSITNKIIWYSKEKFLKGIPTTNISSQRHAWVEIINRILSCHLPLTITQIANVTGLSNTQVEVYLKELIASKGLRSGKFLEEVGEVQFTTKLVEELIIGYLHQQSENNKYSDHSLLTYLPRNDPLLLIYRNYLLKRFKLKSLFLRSIPTDYAELVVINGLPAAALHIKKQNSVEYINNIEILPEYNDSHSLMLIFSAMQEFILKTREKEDRQLRIKQVNGIPLFSEGGREIISLIKDMKLDFIVQPD